MNSISSSVSNPVSFKPIQTILRVLWILLQLVFGAGLGWLLFYGFLNQDGVVVWMGAAIVGLILAGLWAWQGVSALNGKKKLSRGLKFGLVGFAVVVIMALVGLYISYSVTMGSWGTSSEPVKNFEQLWRAMNTAYPYFYEKNVDWQAVHEQYAPRVANVGSEEEYQVLIEEILASLHDGHTSVNRDDGTTCCFAVVSEVEGQPVVTISGSAAREAGLNAGSIILAVDGIPAEKLLAARMNESSASTPQQARFHSYFGLLTRSKDKNEQEIRFIDPLGVEKTVLLTEINRSDQSQNLNSEPVIQAERLSSGVGLIRIPTFGSRNGHDLVAEFDAALNELMDAPGLIIDLRGNGGGSTWLSDQMAGRLISEPFRYGEEHYPLRKPMFAFRSVGSYWLKPRQPVYAGAVVLIIDESNFSTSEQFIAALVDSGRAQTIGRVTSGGSGNPVSFDLPGDATARFSTGKYYRANGSLIEGIGIQPDVVVELNRADIISGRDTMLESAEALLVGN